MRALVQRVSQASVAVDNLVNARIGRGLVVLLGVTHNDNITVAEALAHKVIHLRVFPDTDSKMNLSLLDIVGELLVVSQFTLYADTRKGNRPSYAAAVRPEVAEPLYEHFVGSCRQLGVDVKTGKFQAHMQLALINDGPVTILCESNCK
jgi:D-tyrosyl-tRNA(Tyr) deacylase